jgi:hypothetical protein
VECSEAFLGELVYVPKNVVALAIDTDGRQLAIRLKEGSVFLVVGLGENERNVPHMWRVMRLFKVMPMTYEAYDEFLFPVKLVPISIFVESNLVSLWKENT